jgi:hypothetical protein
MKNEPSPRVRHLAKAFMREDVRACFALLGDAHELGRAIVRFRDAAWST